MKLQDAKLSTADRVTRGALGFVLIGLAYFSTGPLGLYALLPIIAIVPLMSAVLGYCPIQGGFREVWRERSHVAVNRAPVGNANLPRHAH